MEGSQNLAEERTRALERVEGAGLFRAGLMPIFIAGALLLALVAAAVALNYRAGIEREATSRLLAFNASLNQINNQLLNIESSQRGYLVTSREEFLSGYNENLATIGSAMRALAPRAEEAGHRWEFADLTTTINAKIREMREIVALADAGDKNGAISRVQAGVGLVLMLKAQESIARIVRKDNQDILSRQADNNFYGRLLQYINIAGTSLIIALASFSVLGLFRANAALNAARSTLERDNAQLEIDIDERVQALKSANEEIQRFAYIVSHDLRSPLVNIMGFTTELEHLKPALFGSENADRTRAEAEFDESVGFIKVSIGKMERLIAAILKISREGNRPFTTEPIDVNAMMTGILNSLQHQVQAANAQVTVGKLPSLETDRLALEQILSNLTDNAVKYLRDDVPGRIDITGEQKGRRVTIRVADNGRGIMPRDHARVFELFRRAGKQDRPGEGMGLAHTLALARRLNGRIRLESEPDRGSTFTLTLPATFTQHTSKADAI